MGNCSSTLSTTQHPICYCKGCTKPVDKTVFVVNIQRENIRFMLKISQKYCSDHKLCAHSPFKDCVFGHILTLPLLMVIVQIASKGRNPSDYLPYNIEVSETTTTTNADEKSHSTAVDDVRVVISFDNFHRLKDFYPDGIVTLKGCFSADLETELEHRVFMTYMDAIRPSLQ